MRFIYVILTNAVALFIASYILEGLSFEGGWVAPIIAAIVITLLNFLVKPLLKLLSFPLIFLSAGLFLIVINAFILFLAEYLIGVMDITGVSMHVDNLLTYVLAAIIFGLANWLIQWIIKD